MEISQLKQHSWVEKFSEQPSDYVETIFLQSEFILPWPNSYPIPWVNVLIEKLPDFLASILHVSLHNNIFCIIRISDFLHLYCCFLTCCGFLQNLELILYNYKMFCTQGNHSRNHSNPLLIEQLSCGAWFKLIN